MVSSADEVFATRGFGGGSGNFGAEGLFNAGYMVIEPSMKTFNSLLKQTNRAPPRLFRNILDCTEMGLLNQYYHKHLTLLPMASPYNLVKSPFVHWFGDHKPWESLDTSCYPSPYFSNKLWAMTWEETVESMKEFTGNELFQNVFKAVMDRRGTPSQIHNDKPYQKYSTPKTTPYAPYASQPTVESAYESFDAYAYGPHGAYSNLNSYLNPYLEENGFQYLDERSPYLEERFQYLDERTSSPYLEERSFQYSEEKAFQYREEKAFRYEDEKLSPYLEERFQYLDEKAFQYLEEKKFQYLDEKKFQYLEEKKFQYLEEKPFSYLDESKFQYEEEKNIQVGQKGAGSHGVSKFNTPSFVVVGN